MLLNILLGKVPLNFSVALKYPFFSPFSYFPPFSPRNGRKTHGLKEK